MKTLLWYDLETWGLSPKYSTAAQFAAIRTDLDLNEVDEPVMIYAKPRNDILPEPGAVLTTGITPQQAQQGGLVEKDFVARIYAELIRPNTITAGYNTLRFDDEMIRYMLYRNLYDPYEREYANGNNRWDILDLVRAARALRPEGIKWPFIDGEPSNKLEELTKINNIAHDGAHDALVDVRATIDLAKLIKTVQPELYNHTFKLMDKRFAENILSEACKNNNLLIHTSGMFSNSYMNTSLVAVLGRHPSQKNKFIVQDLRVSPEEFLNLNLKEIQERRFSGKESELNRLPVKEINISKSPFIAPMTWFNTACAARIQLDESVAVKHLGMITKEYRKKICAVFEKTSFEKETDVDAMLYAGFASPQDKKELERIRSVDPQEWGSLDFKDKKYASLAKRYLFRNFSDQLSANQLASWEKFRSSRLLAEDVPWMTYPKLEKELVELSATDLNENQKFLLEEVKLYAQSIFPTH